MFKTRLDTFGNDFFGHFWIFENFLIFLQRHFEESTLHGTLGKKKNSKKVPQNMFKTLLDNLGTVLGVFGILKTFDFLKIFRRLDPPWNTGQKIFFEKITPKHVQNTFGQFGNGFGRFWNFENFLIFYKNISKTRPSMEHWANKFSENLPQNMFKTLLAIWEQLWAFLESRPLEHFEKFLKHVQNTFGQKHFEETRPSMEHWAKIFFEKITPKHVQNTFGQFGNNFGHFWNFEKKKFSKKFFKTRLDNFGKFFEDSTLHGTLGKKNFRKKLPQKCSKHVQNTFGKTLGTRTFGQKKFLETCFWTLLGTILGIFFLKIFEESTLHGTLGQKIFRNNYPKTCSFFENIFGILKNFNFFEDSTLHGTLGKKKFSKKVPQNMFKTLFWNNVWNFENFWFFENISKTRPSMEHWATLFKTLLDNLGTILGGILKNF